MFNSKPFFPNYNSDISPMIQCINTKVPVFSRDINKTAAKSFLACGYHEFCFNWYKHLNKKHVYELLQVNKPTKIFLDFDCDDMDNADKVKEEFNNFLNFFIDHIQETFKLDETPFTSVLESCTNVKISYHVIVNLFMENIESVKVFVFDTLDKFPCKYIDKNVYNKNRSFRILYSYKSTKDDTSALTIRGINNTKYNPEYVFLTMIQAYLPPSYSGPFEHMKGHKLHTDIKIYTKLKRSPRISSHLSKFSIPTAFSDYLNRFWNGKIISVRSNDNFISCIVSGMRCPHIQKRHKHNNQYLTINLSNFTCWFTCSDDDCPDAQYGHMSIKWFIEDFDNI